MPLPRRVVIADDLADARWALAELLRREGMEVQEAGDGASALQMIGASRPDVAVFDVRMPGMNGIDALRDVKRLHGNLPVILVTAYPQIQEAVAAMKVGAFDYLARPFDHQKFVGAIKSALRDRPPKDACQEPQAPSLPFLALEMGLSECVRQLSIEVARVAGTNLSVVITGETGSGKEVVARAVHALSPRRPGPFVVVDCGGIPESLLENELFGHERGAFTGADRTATGKFEAAAAGTLFLDEISNLPVALQSKLLRALETKQFYRIGSSTVRKADVRVVAASNRDLTSMVRAGDFREDLFYRLCQYEIRIPPLRERPEDIAFLARRFLGRAKKEFGRDLRGFTPPAIDQMRSYDWPGNVRELQNVVTRAALRAADWVDAANLGLPSATGRDPGLARDFLSAAGRPLPLKEIVHRQTAALERQVLSEVFQQVGGNKARTARLLGLDYKTVLTKIRQYGIKPRGAACPKKSQLSPAAGTVRADRSAGKEVERTSPACGSEKLLPERSREKGR